MFHACLPVAEVTACAAPSPPPTPQRHKRPQADCAGHATTTWPSTSVAERSPPGFSGTSSPVGPVGSAFCWLGSSRPQRRALFDNSEPLGVWGGGDPPPPWRPPPFLKYWAKFSFGPLANQKFSPAPLAPIGLDQKFSSAPPAPLQPQHHWGGGCWDPPPPPQTHPPTPPYKKPCPAAPSGNGSPFGSHEHRRMPRAPRRLHIGARDARGCAGEGNVPRAASALRRPPARPLSDSRYNGAALEECVAMLRWAHGGQVCVCSRAPAAHLNPPPPPLPSCPPVVGKTLCGAVPAPAWEGRQGAEAALVSRGTTVPLLRRNNTAPPPPEAVWTPNRLPPSRRFAEPALFIPPPPPPHIHVWRMPSSKGGHLRTPGSTNRHKWCQNGTWPAKWPELIFSIRACGATRKTVFVFAGSEFGWISASLEMEGKVHLKLRVKLGCSP